MNDSFSIARSMRLLVKIVRENWREFVMMVMMMLGTLLLVSLVSEYVLYLETPSSPDGYSPFKQRDYIVDLEWEVGGILLVAFGTLSASMMLRDMASKPSRLSTLMTPATQGEKFMARFVLYVPVFFALFVACFYIADFVRYAVFVGIVPEDAYKVELFNLADRFDPEAREPYKSLLTCMGLFIGSGSFFALGSSLWPSKSYIKTFFALGVMIVIYLVIAFTAANLANHPHTTGGYVYSTHMNVNMWWFFTAAVAVACVNYTISFFRFRESEIVERW